MLDFHERMLVMFDIGRRVASLSHCKRHPTGVVIFNKNATRILSVDYNSQKGECTGEVGKCGCIHAEINAINALPADSVALRLFTTVSPCFNCAAAIVRSERITHVFYDTLSRHGYDPIYRLRDNGIVVARTFPLC